MDFFVDNQVFVPKNMCSLLAGRHVLATTGQKVPFSQINISILADELKINYTSQVCIPSNEHSGEVAQLCFKNRPDLQNRLPPHIYCHQHRVLVTLVEDYWDDD